MGMEILKRRWVFPNAINAAELPLTRPPGGANLVG